MGKKAWSNGRPRCLDAHPRPLTRDTGGARWKRSTREREGARNNQHRLARVQHRGVVFVCLCE